MDEMFNYSQAANKAFESDNLPAFPDPGDPPDLGSALTQDEIDFVKKLKKELEERFITL